MEVMRCVGMDVKGKEDRWRIEDRDEEENQGLCRARRKVFYK